jgi:DNA-3-methyladenine glycosylase I
MAPRAPVTTERFPTCWGMLDAAYARYHDTEWAVPCHDDRELFERLMLEGFQAGLSWATILRKRENFARAFDGWVAERIAAYGPAEIERLLSDPGIIRNRLKVAAAVRNARGFLELREEFGTFDRFAWSFTGGVTLNRPAPATFAEVPASTPESDAMSKALRKRGFSFVGSTICYAFMQSVGMVNDHLADCPARPGPLRDRWPGP